MKDKLSRLTVLLQSNVRHEQFNGQDHLVAPVVALVEGVHNGILYTKDEIAKFPAAWNGIPIPALHPIASDGTQISANSPAVIESDVIGTFFNAEINAEGKLVGELWINVAKANAISPTVIGLLENHGKLEVSTALFTEDEVATGTFNEETYDLIATNFRPDHLAVLPGATGACSWADGCGSPRCNDAKDHGELKKCDGKGGCGGACNCGLKTKAKKVKPAVNKDRKPLFEILAEKYDRIKTKIKPNEISHGTIRDSLRAAINAETTDRDVYTYIEEVYDNYFVYEANNESSTKLYRRNYNVDADDAILLSADKTEVEILVEYVPVTTNTKKEGGSKMEKKTQDEIIEAIVTNAKIECFGEEHREILATLGEEQLAHILESGAEVAAPVVPVVPAKEEGAAGDDADKTDVTTKALSEADITALVAAGITKALTDQNTAPVIARLVANEACALEEATLKTMSFKELVGYERLINPGAPPVIDYSALGGVVDNSEDNKIAPMPAVLLAGPSKKEAA